MLLHAKNHAHVDIHTYTPRLTSRASHTTKIVAKPSCEGNKAKCKHAFYQPLVMLHTPGKSNGIGQTTKTDEGLLAINLQTSKQLYDSAPFDPPLPPFRWACLRGQQPLHLCQLTPAQTPRAAMQLRKPHEVAEAASLQALSACYPGWPECTESSEADRAPQVPAPGGLVFATPHLLHVGNKCYNVPLWCNMHTSFTWPYAKHSSPIRDRHL